MWIVIALLTLHTTILLFWCLAQHDAIKILRDDYAYWSNLAIKRGDEILDLRQENCSLGQMIDDRKRTINEQNRAYDRIKETLHYIQESVTAELKGDRI